MKRLVYSLISVILTVLIAYFMSTVAGSEDTSNLVCCSSGMSLPKAFDGSCPEGADLVDKEMCEADIKKIKNKNEIVCLNPMCLLVQKIIS